MKQYDLIIEKEVTRGRAYTAPLFYKRRRPRAIKPKRAVPISPMLFCIIRTEYSVHNTEVRRIVFSLCRQCNSHIASRENLQTQSWLYVCQQLLQLYKLFK